MMYLNNAAFVVTEDLIYNTVYRGLQAGKMYY